MFRSLDFIDRQNKLCTTNTTAVYVLLPLDYWSNSGKWIASGS